MFAQSQYLKILQAHDGTPERDGRDGKDGQRGLPANRGPQGIKGDIGPTGPIEPIAKGLVYIVEKPYKY